MLPKAMFGGRLIAISKTQYQRLKRSLGSALYAYIHNGIPVEEFPFCRNKEDYFISINAITPNKGIHNAVLLARKLKVRLLLVGPVRDHEYYKLLTKYFGKEVCMLGEVSEDEKERLLCKARALLFPVEREEPFGLNVVEAMACGTPVLAFNKGAVQEIVRHGVTGFLGSSIEELARYVKRLDELDPVTIREFAWRFSHKTMALKYAIMYKDMLK
jgi:glycosyltransferase involved in cell wall biosynthesis